MSTSIPFPSVMVQTATTYLQNLIQINTTNPPGGETAAARYLLSELGQEGINGRIYEPSPGRGSLVARLPADYPDGSGPILLLAHLDTVAADAKRWRHDPLGGEIIDGELWGRGALDCKGPAAVWAALMVGLRRTGVRRRREIILAATADGERGGNLGIGWIAANFPSEVRCAAALTQGGGWPLRVLGKTYYTYQIAEKGAVTVKMNAHGRAGHAGSPSTMNNAILLLGQALSALAGADLPVHVAPGFQSFVERLAAPHSSPASSHIRSLLSPLLSKEAARYIAASPRQRALLMALGRNTICPTMVSGGSRTWVSPDLAVATLDARILPGQTAETLLGELDELLTGQGIPFAGRDGPYGLELTATQETAPSESPPQTPLARAIERALARCEPAAHLVPIMTTASSGARFLRALGGTAYGFFPTLPEVDLTTVHGLDERISLASLELAMQVVWEVLCAYAGDL